MKTYVSTSIKCEKEQFVGLQNNEYIKSCVIIDLDIITIQDAQTILSNLFSRI